MSYLWPKCTFTASGMILGIIPTCSTYLLLKQAQVGKCATVRCADLFFIWWTAAFASTRKSVWRQGYTMAVILATCIWTRIGTFKWIFHVWHGCATVRCADLFFIWWTAAFASTRKSVWRQGYTMAVILATCIWTRIGTFKWIFHVWHGW